ncbi:MAG: aspartate kinase [Planctomycetes bacterium]|nr:aspartate kinase [Planctomycetota bacterium]
MIVMKFGGSSVAGAERLGRVADRVLAARNLRPCVVVSAMGRTTDALFAAAHAARDGDVDTALATVAPVLGHAEATAGELLGGADARATAAIAAVRDELHVLLRGVAMLRELTPRTTDTIVAYGERLTTLLLAALLAQRGAAVAHVDARRFLRTDARFGHARPQREAIAALVAEHVAPQLDAGRIVVTEGYVGATAEGHTTTLGRGGSDWSASLLGAALRADEVQIWTDVEGVLTADPRLVPEARPIPVLSPAEAAELAAFGAKVLHPATMQPAVDAGVPITVRDTQRPEGAFTTIDPRGGGRRQGVAALAMRGPVTVLTMTSTRMLATSGYLAQLFAAFGALDICIDLVVTAEVSVACTVEPDAPLDRLVAALAGLARVDIARDRAIVAAVGEGLRDAPGVVERACRALSPTNPELLCFGGNDRNLSLVVPREHAAAALQRLHAEFFPAEPARRAARNPAHAGAVGRPLEAQS